MLNKHQLTNHETEYLHCIKAKDWLLPLRNKYSKSLDWWEKVVDAMSWVMHFVKRQVTELCNNCSTGAPPKNYIYMHALGSY